MTQLVPHVSEMHAAAAENLPHVSEMHAYRGGLPAGAPQHLRSRIREAVQAAYFAGSLSKVSAQPGLQKK